MARVVEKSKSQGPEPEEATIVDPGAAERAVRRAAKKPPRVSKARGRGKRRPKDQDGIGLRHLVPSPEASNILDAAGDRRKYTPTAARAAVPEGSVALPAWRPGPGRPPRSPGRPKERTFEEDARDVLSHGVPIKLRALVATRTGMPLDVAAHMSLRQAVILLLIHDAIERGQLDKIDRILDRTDPKSRRVEHRGNVGHLHALAGQVLNMNEGEAAELYRQMAQGGSSLGAAIEAEIVEDEGAA